MANKNTLKGYFNTGDIPNQSQYADLIDSNLNLQETGTQVLVGTLSSSFLEVQNHITSSGNISSSGTLYGSKAYIKGHITASNNISASGTITAEHFLSSDDAVITDTLTAGHLTTTGNLTAGDASTDTHTFTGHITASGNISASGDFYGDSITISGKTNNYPLVWPDSDVITIHRKSFKITTSPVDIPANTLNTKTIVVTNNHVTQHSVIIATTSHPLEVVNHTIADGSFKFQLRSNQVDFEVEEIKINFVVL